MAGYDYNHRSGYSYGKGVGRYPKERSKASYTDDECRTVIVDADGTQRTIIGCTPLHNPGSYVTKTETIIQERVLAPVYPAAYKHSSPPSSPVKSYGYAADDHKLYRPFSPVKGHGYAADDHKMGSPSSPVQGYGYVAHPDHKLRRPSSSPEHDYPHEVGDFLTNVQTEASRDHPGNGVIWRPPPQQTGHNGTTGYGDYGEYNNKTFYKPNGNTFQNGGHQARPLQARPLQARPIPSTWVPPPSREGQLTSATDDMETALRYLKESAKSSSATTAAPQYPHYLAAPKQDEYHTNAAKKNVRFNLPSWS